MESTITIQNTNIDFSDYYTSKGISDDVKAKMEDVDILAVPAAYGNHEFFFANMAPQCNQKNLSKELEEKLKNAFGDLKQFKEKFKVEALDVFGSGYAWLVNTNDHKFKIIKTAD